MLRNCQIIEYWGSLGCFLLRLPIFQLVHELYEDRVSAQLGHLAPDLRVEVLQDIQTVPEGASVLQE